MAFLFVSFLGAIVLIVTEHGHTTIDAYPMHHEVVIRSADTGDEHREVHTTVGFEKNQGLLFVDAWFTSTSGLCVTGLISVDFSQFTFVGQLTVMLLIQIGGLGIFVFTSILVVSIFQGIEQNASFRTILASTIESSHRDAMTMLKYIICYTLALEAAGLLIMGVYLVLIAFFVYARRLFGGRKKHRSSIPDSHSLSGVASIVQVKIAVYGTAALLAVGTVLAYWVEFSNTFVDHPNLLMRILPAWFQSVSTRTAGFNTVDIGAMHIPTLFVCSFSEPCSSPL